MLRFTLDKLEKSGYLKTCKKRVDKEFELGAVLRYFDNEVPIVFKNIKNYDTDLVGGVYGNRKIFNDLMDVNEENRIYKFMDAIANPKSYKEVKSGPIAQNIITKNIDINKLFPIPTSHEKDSSNL